MRTEHPSVGVALVDDDVLQRLQERRPARVGGEDAAVQHVRVGQYVGGVLAYPLALLGRGVAVVERCPDPRGRELGGPAALVGRQGLGGGEVERGRATPVAGLGAVQQIAEYGGQVAQRLARGGSCGENHSLACFG